MVERDRCVTESMALCITQSNARELVPAPKLVLETNFLAKCESTVSPTCIYWESVSAECEEDMLRIRSTISGRIVVLKVSKMAAARTVKYTMYIVH